MAAMVWWLTRRDNSAFIPRWGAQPTSIHYWTKRSHRVVASLETCQGGAGRDAEGKEARAQHTLSGEAIIQKAAQVHAKHHCSNNSHSKPDNFSTTYIYKFVTVSESKMNGGRWKKSINCQLHCQLQSAWGSLDRHFQVMQWYFSLLVWGATLFPITQTGSLHKDAKASSLQLSTSKERIIYQLNISIQYGAR